MGASGGPARAIVATNYGLDTKHLPRFLIYDSEMLHSTHFAALNHFLPPFDLRQRDWPINRFGKFIQVGPLPFLSDQFDFALSVDNRSARSTFASNQKLA